MYCSFAGYIDFPYDELYSAVGQTDEDMLVSDTVPPPPPLCSAFTRLDKMDAVYQLYSRFEAHSSCTE